MNKYNKTETDSEIQRTIQQLPKEGEVGRGTKQVKVQTTSYKINKSQGCNVQKRKYCQYFIITTWCAIPKNTESLCCISEVSMVSQLHITKKYTC